MYPEDVASPRVGHLEDSQAVFQNSPAPSRTVRHPPRHFPSLPPTSPSKPSREGWLRHAPDPFSAGTLPSWQPALVLGKQWHTIQGGGPGCREGSRYGWTHSSAAGHRLAVANPGGERGPLPLWAGRHGGFAMEQQAPLAPAAPPPQARAHPPMQSGNPPGPITARTGANAAQSPPHPAHQLPAPPTLTGTPVSRDASSVFWKHLQPNAQQVRTRRIAAARSSSSG